ncbi:MAG: type II secretion system protein [Candidatus Omnitrophica bacterium]|nr:type II secretion system protein [Candidatus Omnitrophota bacterium]
MAKITGKRNPCGGFTLLELVIAAALLSIAILATSFSILSITDMTELSREKIVAIQDANRVLEEMRNTVNTSAALLRSTDWTAWAAANVVNAKGANDITLNQESITAAFPNAAGNPVAVTLTVNWVHRQRPYAYQIMTSMTDRT